MILDDATREIYYAQLVEEKPTRTGDGGASRKDDSARGIATGRAISLNVSLVDCLPSAPSAGGRHSCSDTSTVLRNPRLPTGVNVGVPAHGVFQPDPPQLPRRAPWVSRFSRVVSLHARALRLRGVFRVLAITQPLALPSTLLNGVGTPVSELSQLNTCLHVPLSTLRWQSRDWPCMTRGQDGSAMPFLYDSLIHNSTPVYPDALSKLLKTQRARTDSGSSTLSIFPVYWARLRRRSAEIAKIPRPTVYATAGSGVVVVAGS